MLAVHFKFSPVNCLVRFTSYNQLFWTAYLTTAINLDSTQTEADLEADLLEHP